MAVSREAVMAALATVPDPSGGDIVAQGRIRSLVVEEGRVGFALAAPGAPGALEPARQAAEAAVSRLPGVERVLAAIVAEEDMPAQPPRDEEGGGLMSRARRLAGRLGRHEAPPAATPQKPAGITIHRQSGTGPGAAPPPPPQPQAAAPKRPAKPAAGSVPGVARIVAVGSGKGGVGKSTVSINLAVALAAAGWRVGLLDADIFGPSLPTLVGNVAYRPQGALTPFEAHGIKAMSIGFLVDPEQAVVWRGPMVTGALNQLLRDTGWGELDCLLIDMPPGTGDVPLSLAQQAPLTGAVVVTTPQDLALVDVRKAVSMFEQVKVPILGVVENMATFICPHCGEATDIFGHGGGEREAARKGLTFLGAVPLTMAIREASDAGRPVALDGASAEGAAYATIAANLMEALEADAPRAFPAIVFD